jgi:rRNA biogenesis protein RRP5
VVGVNYDDKGHNLRIDLSLRASHLTGVSKGKGVGKDGVHRDVADVSALKVKDLVRGYVKSTTKQGCFISLNRSLVARCPLKWLSDKFLPEPLALFPAGKLVTCRIKAISEDGKIDVTLKKSSVNAPRHPVIFEELKEGMLVLGRVKTVDSKLGVFIILKHSKITALCHVSMISDAFVKDPAEHYEAGDRVKAVVTKLDAEKKRVSVALKVINCQICLHSTLIQ